jgi:hypothetical protein
MRSLFGERPIALPDTVLVPVMGVVRWLAWEFGKERVSLNPANQAHGAALGGQWRNRLAQSAAASQKAPSGRSSKSLRVCHEGDGIMAAVLIVNRKSTTMRDGFERA